MKQRVRIRLSADAGRIDCFLVAIDGDVMAIVIRDDGDIRPYTLDKIQAIPEEAEPATEGRELWAIELNDLPVDSLLVAEGKVGPTSYKTPITFTSLKQAENACETLQGGRRKCRPVLFREVKTAPEPFYPDPTK